MTNPPFFLSYFDLAILSSTFVMSNEIVNYSLRVSGGPKDKKCFMLQVQSMILGCSLILILTHKLSFFLKNFNQTCTFSTFLRSFPNFYNFGQN